MAFNGTLIHDSTEDTMPTILQLVLFVILSVLASVGHILVIFAVYRKRELRTKTYLITLNLSIADLLYAAIVLPLEARELFPPSINNCEVTGIILTTFTLASLDMLTFVSIERFMATNYPFKHRQWFTTKAIAIGVAFTWLWCMFFTVIPIFTSGYGYDAKFLHCVVKWRSDKLTTVLFVLFYAILPGLILLYCNIKIVLAVRKRSTVGTKNIRIQTQRRVTMTVIMIILAVCICFSPYLILLGCHAISESCEFSTKYVSAALWILRSNCCANPIVYGLMNKKFRKAFKEVLCCRFAET